MDISALPFTSLRIVFSDDRPEITIEHAEDKSRVVNVGVVKMESLTCKANLHWEIGSRLVISGELQSDLPEDIKACLPNCSRMRLIYKHRSIWSGSI